VDSFETILSLTLSQENASEELPTAPSAAALERGQDQAPLVDTSYHFDVKNSRKPSMRELMEALSGRTVEALYADPSSNWQAISRQASELLYGVTGTNTDTRDWSEIMAAPDIVASARRATGEMYDPVVDIVSEYSDKGKLIDQAVVLKDKTGNILRTIPESLRAAETTLLDFGATAGSVPTTIADKAEGGFISKQLLGFLETYARGSFLTKLETNMDRSLDKSTS
jgi:hypothetical protein